MPGANDKVDNARLLAEDMTVEQYLQFINSDTDASDDMIAMYIKGLSEGIEWMNTRLLLYGRCPLYCTPATTDLNLWDYLELIDSRIDDAKAVHKMLNHSTDDVDYTPVALLLVKGLIHKYPCSVPKRETRTH